MFAKSGNSIWNVDGAIEMARNLVSSPQLSLPINICELASALGVARVEAADMSIDGYLGRGSDGRLLIRYKTTSPMTRNRFTIAHELGHILLYRASSCEIPECATRARNRCTDEELAANRVASELLMPCDAVRTRLAYSRLSWERIRELSREFDVSITAFSRRIIEVTKRPTVMFWATVSDKDPSIVRSCRCSVSMAHQILFSQPPTLEAQHLIDSLEGGEVYHPRAFIDADECLLQWDAMKVEKFNRAQHWFLCWELTRR